MRLVAKRSHTSRGRPPSPRHGFRREPAKENGHLSSGRSSSLLVGSVDGSIMAGIFPTKTVGRKLARLVFSRNLVSPTMLSTTETTYARVRFLNILFLIALPAAIACRPERAAVEDLYTARMLGLSYLERNQLPEAEAEFRKLTQMAPDDPLGYTNLGLTYLQGGKYADAEKALARARELDPGNIEVGLALARLYSLTARPADA